MKIKAIETVYDGYHFRSRLEARWAVLFNSLSIEYEYEPEGFHLETWEEDRTIPYLPDFFLPAQKIWVEVKGSTEKLNFKTLAWCVDWYRGLPYMSDTFPGNSGMLILGNIPKNTQFPPVHPLLQHSKGGWVNLALFFPRNVLSYKNYGDVYFDASWGDHNGTEWVEYVKNRLHGVFCIPDVPCHPEVRAAYKKARQARFEHGEAGL